MTKINKDHFWPW